MQPNQAQERAIRHYTGPCMVLAGPGSGKTFTIAGRTAYLIGHYGVRPEEILVITFTRAASAEMRSRFFERMNGEKPPVTFGTFHGVYFGILRWAYRLNSENILTETEKYRLLRQILESPETGYETADSEEREEIGELITEIGNVKNRGISLSEYRSPRFGKDFGRLFEAYERQRKALRKIDFDDMLLLCLELFRKRPDILKQWQERFRFILIDEFQDVNRIQYEVIRLLALPENNLFVVGDDDQSIYRFRGASPEIMLGFGRDYPDAERILLPVNYRSAGNIVNGALRVIGHNTRRFPKKLRAAGEKGVCIHVQEVKDAAEESRYLAGRIRKLTAQGIPDSEIAVLFRTAGDAGVLLETLTEEGIPFQYEGRIRNLYDHFIAGHLNGYLRLAEGERSRRLFLSVMNAPVRYLGRESLERETVSFEDLRRFYMDKAWMLERIDRFEQDVRMLAGQTPYAAIQYIRRQIGYDDYLKSYAAEHRENEEELFAVLEEIQEKAKEYATAKEWFAYQERYAEALRKRAGEQAHGQGGVRLMTMHGSKGLEFDTVFIIQSSEGSIPYRKAKLKEDIEEERRMFYVAMTRARRELIISYGKTKNGKELSPSRFVRELLVTG